jgi:hypothetical protein
MVKGADLQKKLSAHTITNLNEVEGNDYLIISPFGWMVFLRSGVLKHTVSMGGLMVF